ncbi:MAG: hypothetical protein QW304_08325 [Thermoproteota archaeon]
MGAILGGIIGVLISSYIGDIVIGQLLDEEGCIWWWISQAFVSWLIDNARDLYRLYRINKRWAYYTILYGFLTYGYLRIGPITFYDGIGVGDPAGILEPV